MAVGERIIKVVAGCFPVLVEFDKPEYGGRGVFQQPNDSRPIKEVSPPEREPTVTSSISGKTGFLS